MNKAARNAYLERKKACNLRIGEVKKQLRLLVMLRLLSFALFGAAIYFAVKWSSAFGFLVAGSLFLFLVLVKRHKTKKQHLLFEEAMRSALEDELNVLDGGLPNLDVYVPVLPPKHPFANDLDLFGANSIFQIINRSYSIDGQALLANRLSTIDGSEEMLNGRQSRCKEASLAHEWRLKMRTAGSLLDQSSSAMKALRSWSASPPKDLPPAWTRMAVICAPFFSVLLILATYFGLISVTVMFFFFMIPLTLVGSRLKKMNALSNSLGKSKQTLDTLQVLFDVAHDVPEDAPLLRDLSQQLQEGRTAMKELSSIVEMFDQRNNLLAVFVLNALLVQDLRSERRLVTWLSKHGVHMNTWLSVLAELEMLSSLGTLAYHIEDHSTYPQFQEGIALQASEMKHLFMLSSGGVSNDVSLDGFPSFDIITGANMAGKSTYLRTVGTAYVMANAGLPVLAKSFIFSAAPLFTSMRTSDSLQEGKSYFLSELERLAQLVSMAKNNEAMVVLLDEILKGTNSKDKASGSRSFVQQLMKYRVAGMVATHDLSLCSVTEGKPNMKNVHFSANIKGDDLHFDYRLKPGVCDTMNATFLMKKLGIVEE